MRDYLVSGVPLRDPQGKYFIDYTRSVLLGDLSRTINSNSTYGYHGDTPETDNYFGTSKETIVLNVLGDDKEEHQKFLKGFHSLFSRIDFPIVTAPQRSSLAAGSGRAGRSFNVSNDLVHTARGRMVGSLAIERLNETTARITIILELISGFYRSLNEYTSASIPITAATVTADLAAIAGDSTAPITVGKMRVKGPIAVGGWVRVYDRALARGVGVRAPVSTAISATEYVILDFETLKASKATTDSWTGTTNMDNRVDIFGEGAFFFDAGEPESNWPDSMDYSATLKSVGYTAGTTAVEFRVKRSYLS